MYEGTANNRRDLGTFCGKTVPSKFRSLSRDIVVHFTTDSSINRKGFVAGYSYAEGKLNTFITQELKQLPKLSY